MTEAPAQPRKAPGKRISFALAILMHVGLAILIIYGIHWQTQKPEVVEVDLVRAAPPAPAPASEPKPEPKPELKPEPKPVPKPEPVKPPPKPDIAQKEKPKPPPAPPKQEPKPEPPDPFKEQLERELKDAEKRKVADAAAQELANLKTQQAKSAQVGEMEKYIAAIRGKVRGNIILPGDIKGNPEAVFEVTQLPSGEILSVKLKKSSGHVAWDNATERAILKSSPLPKPQQSSLFSRSLELKFRPLDE
jgi:colicin import membrane protein